MIFNKKDILKILSISIIACCAAMICNMFLNFLIDLYHLDGTIDASMRELYDTMKTSSVSTAAISGGMMITIALVMLVFYIKSHIEKQRKELGILKALGYSASKIACKFWVFGLGIFLGASCGYLISYAILPKFYETQNSALPFTVVQNCNLELIIFIIVLPTLIFLLLSFVFAYCLLKKPALILIRGNDPKHKAKKAYGGMIEKPFLKCMRGAVLREKKTLIIFSVLAPFCYAGNLQMGLAMREYTSEMMSSMIIFIGLLIAVMVMFLSLSSLINGNNKNISVMRLMGYSYSDCKKTIVDIYRPLSYAGFILGSAYQAFLLKIMVNVVFADFDNVEPYRFDWIIFGCTLISFIIFYELTVYIYSKRIGKISPKEIMME